ncbi:transient receptor potential cation channel subfamily A member 1b [Anguilla rostrata]|uniref:transient receptor potential cation channel subfamily A member 1b n=1 Tax=Anguilla rostrata TaxID=7938 RepID=UPI0030D160B6
MITQNSCYECVIEDDDTTQASQNVLDWARQDNVDLLENLLYKHPEYLRIRDRSNAGALHHAASGGGLRVMRMVVIMAGAEELSAADDEGNTPLHWAVQRNNRESCVALLELGADPNVLNRAVLSPLHLAVCLGHNGLVTLLLSHSTTNANLEGDLGNTPVMMACSSDNCEALCTLLDHGAKMCHQNKLGHFPIHAAAFAGAKKAMECILSKGEEYGHSVEVHINYLDKSKSSPLHLAVRGGNIETIKFCISKGARIEQKQCDKSTPLHFACTQGAIEVVKLMISAYNRVEDIINITDGANQTPLHKATIFDHVELVEYLISQGADINHIDCKGHTPLLLATSCGAWRSVEALLSRGANIQIKDKAGRNFLHLAVLQPKGLKNLPENVLELDSVRELLSDEDWDGCTPLHYACRMGIAASVQNMLGLKVSPGRKSKDKKSALHFAAQFGRINTCERLLESMSVSKLLNEGDENGMTPLHLASQGGHTKVVDLLLRKGALYSSDYKGWTSLHHAAAEGYTQTMKILLNANIKLLDKTDEEGNTALHVAAKEGHTTAVRLLLSRGAEFTLNNNDSSFLHEAVHHGRKGVANAAIESERCNEAVSAFKPGSTKRCVVMDMIEFLPESFKYLLDLCVKESDQDPNSHEYWIEYDFRYLQAPIIVMKYAKTNSAVSIQPLAALNAMAQYNRVELLTHPVCKKYLEMKWHAYGSKAHILNLAVYSLGLLPLSFLIVNMRPSWPTNSTSVYTVDANSDKRGYFNTICMFLVLAMNVYAVGKEILQIVQQRSNYFRDISNCLDWLSATFSILFVIPLLLNVDGTLHWQAGAYAVTVSWINFLLYLQRFEHFGIYVVMFGEIMRTLVSIITIFFFLMLAFALGFHALMIEQEKFGRLDISLMQTFVMMVGELNYQENFLNPYLNHSLPFPYLTYFMLVWFILLMPILLMNLLIGLAVGDIAEVQKNATLKRIAMQIDLHTSLEEKLPYWFIKRVDQSKITEYPNRKCKSKAYFLCFFLGWEEKRTVRTHLKSDSGLLTPVEYELKNQKCRLKEMASVLEKQYNLLKLIIQKMEIVTEADDQDGPELAQSHFEGRLAKRSKWIPLVKAVVKKE